MFLIYCKVCFLVVMTCHDFILHFVATKNTSFSDRYPDAPCMDYLPTSGEKQPHSMGNVGIPYMEHLG